LEELLLKGAQIIQCRQPCRFPIKRGIKKFQAGLNVCPPLVALFQIMRACLAVKVLDKCTLCEFVHAHLALALNGLVCWNAHKAAPAVLGLHCVIGGFDAVDPAADPHSTNQNVLDFSVAINNRGGGCLLMSVQNDGLVISGGR
jgi:hypothetical protein